MWVAKKRPCKGERQTAASYSSHLFDLKALHCWLGHLCPQWQIDLLPNKWFKLVVLMALPYSIEVAIPLELPGLPLVSVQEPEALELQGQMWQLWSSWSLFAQQLQASSAEAWLWPCFLPWLCLGLSFWPNPGKLLLHRFPSPSRVTCMWVENAQQTANNLLVLFGIMAGRLCIILWTTSRRGLRLLLHRQCRRGCW